MTEGSKRRSAEEWGRLLTEQAESGQSQAAFCRSRGLSVATLQYWKRRLAQQTPTAPAGSSRPWLELPLALESPRSGWDIELDLGGGVVLRLSRH